MLKKFKYTIRLFALKYFGLIIERNMPYLERKRNPEFIAGDYIRKSSLELVAYEIYKNKIPGSVAEVGVYKGDFARIINYYFPDRKLYLFDTFEGFDERDKIYDRKFNFSDASQDFSNVSIESVLEKMPYKQNIIIKKGYFPDTAKDIEDIFCFVSIDVDLYKSTKSALEFFWPRLKKGYIFVHDFYNDGYKGVQQAVYEFSKENDVPYFPLTDVCGSAVIMK